jgi:hypothetical protein
MTDDSDPRRLALNERLEADEAYYRELDQHFAVAVAGEPIAPQKVLTDEAMKRLETLRTERDEAKQRLLKFYR